jgi:UDP:flavonoid glycosyltransferase YjiC (YdhE family)
MRVLFCSPPLAGHTLTMLPLARALRRAGHAVQWASGKDMVAAVGGNNGFELHVVCPPHDWCRGEMLREWPERASLPPRDAGREAAARLFGSVIAPAMLPALEALLDRWQPDLVVHDTATFAAPLACKTRGLRNVSHAFGLPRPADRVTASMQRLAPLWCERGDDVPAEGGNFQHAHIDICPPRLRAASGIINPHACPTFALRPHETTDSRAASTSHRTSLLVFGTVHNQCAAFDAALTALDSIAGPGLPVRAALGPGRAAPLRADAPHVRVQAWLDLAAELPQCASMVCHGGAGTLFAALAHGVPMVLLPQGADQFHNADAAAALGAGLVLEGAQQRAGPIADAVSRLHAEPAFAAGAARCAEEIAAMPGAEEVAAQLVQF